MDGKMHKKTQNMRAIIHSKTLSLLLSLESDFIWKYKDTEGSTITGEIKRRRIRLLPDPVASGIFCISTVTFL